LNFGKLHTKTDEVSKSHLCSADIRSGIIFVIETQSA